MTKSMKVGTITKAPTPNISTRSNPKSRAKKRAQHLKNKQARADLYARMDGEISHALVPEWHRTLSALSKGTL
jgi:hypothetical protein